MGELTAIAYRSEDDARAAYARAEKIWERAEPDLYAIAYVGVDGAGATSVETPQSAASTGPAAVGSVVLGALIGSIFLVPVLGIAVGATAAALFASAEQPGLTTQARNRIRGLISPGHSGVILYSSTAAAGILANAIAGPHAHVAHTALSESEERALAQLVDGTGSQSTE